MRTLVLNDGFTVCFILIAQAVKIGKVIVVIKHGILQSGQIILQIGQILIHVFEVLIHLILTFLQFGDLISHLFQDFQDLQQETLVLFVFPQVHAIRQTLEILYFLEQITHFFLLMMRVSYDLDRYSPERVSILITSPMLINSGTMSSKPVSVVAGL